MTPDHGTYATAATAQAFGFTCVRAAHATRPHEYARAAGTAAALQRVAVYAGHYDTAAFAMRVGDYCRARERSA